MKITGEGFPANLKGWTSNSVSFGGNDCPLISATKTSVSCRAPAGVSKCFKY